MGMIFKNKLIPLLLVFVMAVCVMPVCAQEADSIEVVIEDITGTTEALPLLAGEAKIKVSAKGMDTTANLAQLILNVMGNMKFKSVQYLIENEDDVRCSLQAIPDDDVLALSAVFVDPVIKLKKDELTDICIITFRGDIGDSMFVSLLEDADKSYFAMDFPASDEIVAAVMSGEEVMIEAAASGSNAVDAKVTLEMNKVTDFDMSNDDLNIDIEIIGEDDEHPIMFTTSVKEHTGPIVPTLVVETVLAAEQTYTVKVSGPGYATYEKTGVDFKKKLKITNDEFVPGDVNDDGVVDDADKAKFEEIYESGNYSVVADFNRDGVINDKDAKVFKNIVGAEWKVFRIIADITELEAFIQDYGELFGIADCFNGQELAVMYELYSEKDYSYLTKNSDLVNEIVVLEDSTVAVMNFLRDLNKAATSYRWGNVQQVIEEDYIHLGNISKHYAELLTLIESVRVNIKSQKGVYSRMNGMNFNTMQDVVEAYQKAYEKQLALEQSEGGTSSGGGGGGGGSSFISVTGLEIDKESVVMNEGKTITLYARVQPENASNDEVIWVSSDEDVATVDENGVVTALKEGTTVIIAISLDGYYTDRCKVNVQYCPTVTTYKTLISTYKFYIQSPKPLIGEYLAVACYDEYGRMISVRQVQCDGDTEYTASVPIDERINYAKVFVWDSYDNLKPIGAHETIDMLKDDIIEDESVSVVANYAYVTATAIDEDILTGRKTAMIQLVTFDGVIAYALKSSGVMINGESFDIIEDENEFNALEGTLISFSKNNSAYITAINTFNTDENITGEMYEVAETAEYNAENNEFVDKFSIDNNSYVFFIDKDNGVNSFLGTKTDLVDGENYDILGKYADRSAEGYNIIVVSSK